MGKAGDFQALPASYLLTWLRRTLWPIVADVPPAAWFQLSTRERMDNRRLARPVMLRGDGMRLMAGA